MVATEQQFQDQSGSIRLKFAEGEREITIPDSHLMFNGDYSRSGEDLLISADFSQSIRIIDYFADGSPLDLVSPEGARLSGSVVNSLAGPLYPGQYAQASSTGQAAGADPIGQVESISVGASVQRADGTVEPLAVGTKVFQNDVVSTVEGGELSITFVDGTIFSLASKSRMVLDDFIYDPASQDNGATFNLVEGAFVFIAGNVAGSGGMEINTPVSTLGIRGTTVTVEIETVNGTTRVNVALNRDPDGGLGSIEISDLNGNLIATVTSDDTAWTISPVDGETQQVPRSTVIDADDQTILSQAVEAYQASRERVDGGGEFVEGGTSGEDPPPPPPPEEGQDPNAPPPEGGEQGGEQGGGQPGQPPSSGLGPTFISPEGEGNGEGDPPLPDPLPPNAPPPSGPSGAGPEQPPPPPAPPEEEAGGGEGDQQITVTGEASLSVVVIEDSYDLAGPRTTAARFYTNDGSSYTSVTSVTDFYRYDNIGKYYSSGYSFVLNSSERLNFSDGNYQYLTSLDRENSVELGLIQNLDVSSLAATEIRQLLTDNTTDNIYIIAGELAENANYDSGEWTISGNVTDALFTGVGIRAFYKVTGSDDLIGTVVSST
ncbi:MAG: FecR family protein [Rhizobiaceae bacterium]